MKPPQSLNIGVFNVRGCSTNGVKKGEIGKMFLRRRFDVCALSETKLKGKGEVMFDEVAGRVSGVAAGRAREGVALYLSGRLDMTTSPWCREKVIIIIIYHDFLPTPRRGSHVKSGKTHTQSSRYTP